MEKDDTESGLMDNEESQETQEQATEDLHTNIASTSTRTPSSMRKRANTSTTVNATDMAILKALEATGRPQPPAEIDEDAGFFPSITPYVKKFNEDQKLTFQMRVLALIQKIKMECTTIPPGPPSNDPSMASHSSYGTYNHADYHSPRNADEPVLLEL